MEAGAEKVQMDFTEARLSLKVDPTGKLLKNFVDLNNRVFDRFQHSPEYRNKIGIHVCPGNPIKECRMTYFVYLSFFRR